MVFKKIDNFIISTLLKFIVGKQKTEVTIHTIAGILSVLFIIGDIIGILYSLGIGTPMVGAADIIFLVVMIYIAYKTLIKKKKLTLWEWIIFIILLIIFAIGFLTGFISGFTGANP